MARILATLTLAAGFGAIAVGASAAEMPAASLATGFHVGVAGASAAQTPAPPGSAAGVSAVLASVTVLPDMTMAKQTGTGLRLPVVPGGPPAHLTVTLWDEMKPTPQLPMAPTGSVTTNFGGVGK